MRTIRYADEVWTQNGIVDVLRFEDYVVDRFEDCASINYQSYDEKTQGIIKMFSHPGECKVKGETYPNKHCKGCMALHRDIPVIGIMATAFEVKISKSDFKSKNGHNIDDASRPIANENYYTVPKELVKEITPLVPDHVGILSYSEKSGLRKVKDATWLDVLDSVMIQELYNALKKWCDHKQQ